MICGFIAAERNKYTGNETMKKYKIGFDIGGVLSTHTTLFRDLINIFEKSQQVEIFIVTDMCHDIARSLLRKNHFKLGDSHILCANWSKSESRCKEDICKRYEIDILIDDHMPYLTSLSDTLGLLVMPKKDLPFNSKEWQGENEQT